MMNHLQYIFENKLSFTDSHPRKSAVEGGSLTPSEVGHEEGVNIEFVRYNKIKLCS